MTIFTAFLLLVIWILAAASYSMFKAISNIWTRGKLELNTIERCITAPVTFLMWCLRRPRRR